MTRTAGPAIRRGVVLPRVTAVPGPALFSPGLSLPPEETAGSAAVVPVPAPARVPAPVAAPESRRTRVVLIAVAAAALLAAVPLLVVTVPGGSGHHSGSSAANRAGGRNPGAPAPHWPGAVPAGSPSAGDVPTVSPSASAKPGAGGGTSGQARRVREGLKRQGVGGPSARPAARPAAPEAGRARGGELDAFDLSYASNRCISVSARKAKDGSPLQIWDCGGSSWQKWAFKSDGSVRSMGMCMDVAWGSSDDGTTIQLARCHGGPAQHFDLNGAGDLVNLGADKCVDVTGQRTGNGTAPALAVRGYLEPEVECRLTPGRRFAARQSDGLEFSRNAPGVVRVDAADVRGVRR